MIQMLMNPFSTVIDDAVPACAMLHFIVMDHDVIGRNDFAGEAFIQLEDVPGYIYTFLFCIRFISGCFNDLTFI